MNRRREYFLSEFRKSPKQPTNLLYEKAGYKCTSQRINLF